MRPVIGLFLVSCLLMSAGCYPFLEHEYERTPLGDSIDKATLKLLHEAYKASDDKNVITSPLGIMLLLSLYQNGAGDQTKQEISTLLGGGDPKQMLDKYSGLSHEFAAMDPNFLAMENRIYVAQHYELVDTFSNLAKTGYNSEVKNLDFTKPVEAAKVINEWADEKTHGHIKEPVSPDILTPDTAAALFNIIFFQGHWHVPFSASETKEKDFHVNKNSTVKKPTMHLLQSLFYTESEELGAKLVELPYKESNFRMVVVLPNEVDGLSSVIEKASQKGLLEDVFKLSPAGSDVDLEIPKFEIKSKLDLNDILPKVGVSQIFSEPATGIVKGTPVKVSKAFQEAFVKIDEEGATAGAFTGIILVLESTFDEPLPPMPFKVDHPFMYLILYKDNIVFAGTYTN